MVHLLEKEMKVELTTSLQGPFLKIHICAVIICVDKNMQEHLHRSHTWRIIGQTNSSMDGRYLSVA